MYQWLDSAPRGRNESGVWWRRHDQYEPDRGVDVSRLGRNEEASAGQSRIRHDDRHPA
jgi:hypothetical protein